jgi:hypothetical protein
MSYRKLLFVLSFVVLVLWLVQEVSAAVPPFPTGGTVRGPRKQAPNTDLICDLGDPASDVKFTTLPSEVEPTAPPSFNMSGLVRCWEVPAGGTPAQVQPPGKGLFLLTQVTVLDQSAPGFSYTQTGPCPAAGCERTFRFINGEDANVLYELKAFDAIARAFCLDVSPNEECKVYFGLQNESSPAGVVIQFQTKTILQNGNLREVPVGDVTWRLCHNLAFSAVRTFVVDAHLNSSTDNTPSDGFVAVPVNTGIQFNAGDPLIVSVDPRAPNIWNSGVNRSTGVNNCEPFCRWSNADGQVRDFVARNDDGPMPAQSSAAISGEPPGTLIGVNWFEETQEQHTQGNLTAAFGALVGRLGSTFFVLGTDFNGIAPATGTLELFYWDLNNHDNEGSVTVQVLPPPGPAISCLADGQSTEAQADIRGFRPVEVKGFPILDVKHKLPYPLAVVACTQGDTEIGFAKNGDPIKPDTVLVNNVEVDVEAFVVANLVVPGPSCDPTKKAPDLNLLLDGRDIAAAIAPGGKCTNGPFTFNIVFHDRAQPPGFYGAEVTSKLIGCK